MTVPGAHPNSQTAIDKLSIYLTKDKIVTAVLIVLTAKALGIDAWALAQIAGGVC